ncbi:MAG: ATP-binding protein [Bacteroidetes bacterium]|nr:MAG: ATP-binding protein [Bacteroidota bacterium]
MELNDLRRMVSRGEGMRLEFKRKANHPDKIARELVAFANSEGGILLIGVDDDRTIYGCKFPEEDAYAVLTYVEKNCVPALPMRMERVLMHDSREVLVFHIKESPDKPHFVLGPEPGAKRQAFIRVADMSVVASREMVGLMRAEKRSNGVSLIFGDRERQLMQYLEKAPRITLDETTRLLGLSRRKASGLLVLLVRAGLLTIHPGRQGDHFAPAPGL